MQRTYVFSWYATIFGIASAARFPDLTSSALLLTASAHRDAPQFILTAGDFKGHKPHGEDLDEDSNDDSGHNLSAGSLGKWKEKERTDRWLATGLAMMFLGVVFLAGFISFLLAYPDDQVRYYCVRIASSTVTIFLAISIEYAALLSTIVGKVTGWKVGWKNKILPFFVYWGLTLLVSYKARHSHLNMMAAKMVLSHVSAFVAIYFFSDLMYKYAEAITDFTGSREANLASKMLGARTCIWTCCGIFLWILKMGTMKLVQRLPYDCVAAEGATATDQSGEGHHSPDSHVIEGERARRSTAHERRNTGRSISRTRSRDSVHSVHLFMEEMEEAFEESSLLVLSYLWVKFLAYKTILDFCELDHTDDTYIHRRTFWKISNDHVQNCVMAMAMVTITLQVAVLVLDKRFTSRYHLHALPMFFSMCVAWSFMHFMKCMLMAVPISEAHCVLVCLAFLMTPAAGLLVMAADYLADLGFISDEIADILVTSYGFMIGFSWEKAYHSSTHLLLDDYLGSGVLYGGDNEDTKWLWTVAICAGAVMIMLPGWRFLILPSALKPMPPRIRKVGKTSEE